MDLQRTQIRNGWILWSLFAGFSLRILLDGPGGVPAFMLGAVLPLVIVGWLFYFRMLGPGDIKLFCALGGIMGPIAILKCIMVSFLIGAVLSLAILISCGIFCQRFLYLLDYLNEFARTGKRKPYYKKGMAMENIHFSVPIFLSVMLYTGGIY